MFIVLIMVIIIVVLHSLDVMVLVIVEYSSQEIQTFPSNLGQGYCSMYSTIFPPYAQLIYNISAHSSTALAVFPHKSTSTITFHSFSSSSYYYFQPPPRLYYMSIEFVGGGLPKIKLEFMI